MPENTVVNEAVEVTTEVAEKTSMKSVACVVGGFIIGGATIIAAGKLKKSINKVRSKKAAEKAMKEVGSESADEE